MLRNVCVLILFSLITFNLAEIPSYTMFCLEAMPILEGETVFLFLTWNLRLPSTFHLGCGSREIPPFL